LHSFGAQQWEGDHKLTLDRQQEQLAEEFASYVKTTGKPISMAQLQGHFMLFKEQPQDAISHVKLLYAS